MVGIGWLVGLVGLAWAGDISVESDTFASREEAMAQFSAVQDSLGQAPERPRLVRRYYAGEGWRFLIVVEGLDDPRAEEIASLAGGMSIIRPATPDAAAPDAVPPEPAIVVVTPEPEPEPEPEVLPDPRELVASERLPEAGRLLKAAVKAHGGTDGAGNRVKGAQTVRFSYDRVVPSSSGTLVAGHEFLRRGDALRLDVDIREGEGVSSVTTLTADQRGYLSVDGAVTERDGLRTLEMLERFSPEALLSIPLGLPEDVESAAEWRDLQTVGRESSGEQELWVLEGTLSEDGLGLREAAFDAEGKHLVRVSWVAEKGEVTFTYSDYRAVGVDLVVPFATRIEQDGSLVEEIRVAALELDGELAAGLFVGAGEE